jgi:DNA-binding NtrC family response regulator
MRLDLPPLRERALDIPLLINHFLNKQNLERGKRIKRFDPRALKVLLQYEYPGNIRELENIIEHACLLCPEEMIGREHLPSQLLNRSAGDAGEANRPVPAQAEAGLIREALRESGWNRQEAARLLNMDRTTLWRKMKRYKLQP